MNHQIPLKSLTSVPSGYDCPDGDLAVSLNLLHEDGALRPVASPVEIATLTDCRLLLTHTPSTAPKNLIFLYESTGAPKQYKLAWLSSAALGEIDCPQISVSALPDSNIIDTLDSSPLDVTVIGNTVAVATDKGILYFLWRDSRYVSLGSRPAFVPISFGLDYAGCLGAGETVQRPVNLRLVGDGASQQHPSITESKEQQLAWSNAVLGGFLQQVKEKVTTQGFFYQPFFVRYAFRLFDGSYAWHSAPVLMVPTSHAPLVQGTFPSTSDHNHINLDYSATRYYELRHRVHETVNPAWKDVVQAVDIFVSAPIYTYDQSADVTMQQKTYTAALSEQQPVTPHERGRFGASVLQETTPKFLGTYADDNQGYHAHYHIPGTTEPPCSNCFPLAPNQRFTEQITSASVFYKVASIPFDDITADVNYTPVRFDITDLSALQALPVLPDDYRSHYHITASHLFAYNSRLHAVPDAIMPPAALPANSVFHGSQDSHVPTEIQVLSHLEGGAVVVNAPQSPYPYLAAPGSIAGSGSSLIAPDFPRFIFHPDPTATRLVIYQGQQDPQAPNRSIYWEIPLKRHDFLNGSYWYAGMGADPAPSRSARISYPPGTAVDTPVPVTGRIYVSDASNPFVFPAANAASIGSSCIRALSTTAKALSQGQFGQFPLYAFTDEGVWALEPAANGSYASRQPVCRDVCTNPAAITPIDGAVVFPSARGFISLSGSEASCLTDIISLPSDISSVLPFASQAGAPVPDASASGISAIQRTLPAYDYNRQRLWFLPAPGSGLSHAWVFSLRSRSWGMAAARESVPVNNYPDAYVNASQGGGEFSLLSFSATPAVPDSPTAVTLLTRPFSISDPDSFKTVRTVLLRGMFPVKSLRTVLLGTRDHTNWQLVRSSLTSRISNFSGTPYRQFCVLAWGWLGPADSLSAVSLAYDIRLANRLR